MWHTAQAVELHKAWVCAVSSKGLCRRILWLSFPESATLCSFEDYKKNENKQVKVEEILGADVARKAIRDAMVDPSSFSLLHCTLSPCVTSPCPVLPAIFCCSLLHTRSVFNDPRFLLRNLAAPQPHVFSTSRSWWTQRAICTWVQEIAPLCQPNDSEKMGVIYDESELFMLHFRVASGLETEVPVGENLSSCGPTGLSLELDHGLRLGLIFEAAPWSACRICTSKSSCPSASAELGLGCSNRRGQRLQARLRKQLSLTATPSESCLLGLPGADSCTRTPAVDIGLRNRREDSVELEYWRLCHITHKQSVQCRPVRNCQKWNEYCFLNRDAVWQVRHLMS